MATWTGVAPTFATLGVLGATPPAVKGMAPIKFAEGDEITLEFQEQEEGQMDEKTVQGMVRESIQ